MWFVTPMQTNFTSVFVCQFHDAFGMLKIQFFIMFSPKMISFVIIFGHHVINFDHKIYYKADHRRIQCHGDVLSSLGSRNTNGWIIQASNHLQKAWDIILSWILSDFWLAGLGFHLSEPQKSKFHNSGDEKHKVEHLSFLKHPKVLPNSS